MIRPALAVILLLLAVIMMRGVADDWQKSTWESSAPSAKKSTSGSEALPPGAPVVPLQPSAPATLPDLKVGYVFNPERMLGGGEPVMEEIGEEEGAYNDNAEGITADIEEITFVGSVIADNFSWALISYPVQNLSGPAKPTSRSSKNKGLPQGARAGAEEHAQLEVGDKISGFEVVEILADKLIFSNDEETVEKLLFDPSKTRQAPTPRPGIGPPGGGPPRPPSPGGVLSTTIGGGGATANPFAGGGGGAPPPPPLPVVPASQPMVHPSDSPRTVSSPSSPPSVPVRRMVISRQASPAPDTSKVMRQGRGGDEVVPLPPGMETGSGGTSNEMPSTPGMN